MRPSSDADCIAIYRGDCNTPDINLNGPLFSRWDMRLKKRFGLWRAAQLRDHGRSAERVRHDQLQPRRADQHYPRWDVAESEPERRQRYFRVTSAYTDINTTFDPGGRIGSWSGAELVGVSGLRLRTEAAQRFTSSLFPRICSPVRPGPVGCASRSSDDMPVSTGAPCAPPGRILWSLSIALRSSAIICAADAGGFVSFATCTSCLSGGVLFFSGGLRPADPPTRSLAGAPTPRSARVAHSLARSLLPGGFAPPDPPTRSLAGAPTPRSARVAHSLRSLAFLCPGGFAPPDPPARSLAGPPTPRSARVGSLASLARFLSGGFAPPDPPARSLAGAPSPRSARVGSLASLVRFLFRGLRPAEPANREPAPPFTPDA